MRAKIIQTGACHLSDKTVACIRCHERITQGSTGFPADAGGAWIIGHVSGSGRIVKNYAAMYSTILAA